MVVAQNPAGGVKAEPGSTVSITVGRFAATTTSGRGRGNDNGNGNGGRGNGIGLNDILGGGE
jgi:hypothetical protein